MWVPSSKTIRKYLIITYLLHIYYLDWIDKSNLQMAHKLNFGVFLDFVYPFLKLASVKKTNIWTSFYLGCSAVLDSFHKFIINSLFTMRRYHLEIISI